jgi:tetrachloro-p-hydroquinone reductive dehalogenase
MTARLHHAAPSYYSAIARLALLEAKVAFTPVKVDIHRRMEQLAPDYVRLNPNMTVPTLVLDDRVLTESRDILAHALGTADGAAAAWVDRHYAFPVEELTFGKLLDTNPLARRMVPHTMERTARRLSALADAHPDLADRYRARAEVFAARRRTFDPEAVAALFVRRKREALALLDALDAELTDGRAFLAPPSYGPADVVWTVFTARMRFVRMADEITKRPALARWEAAMRERPTYRAADVWDAFSLLKMAKQVL